MSYYHRRRQEIDLTKSDDDNDELPEDPTPPAKRPRAVMVVGDRDSSDEEQLVEVAPSKRPRIMRDLGFIDLTLDDVELEKLDLVFFSTVSSLLLALCVVVLIATTGRRSAGDHAGRA